MEFRTPIGKINSEFGISHSDKILMLGSCFTDSIGERLEHGGFDVVRNPGGPLFNPASIAGAITHADTAYTARDLVEHEGIYHCLDFASRFSGKDAEEVLDRVNAVRETIADRLACADLAIITFGTTRIYKYGCKIAGNCHRLPAATFSESNLAIDEITGIWSQLADRLPKRVIFTVSPIRYTAYGLDANFLSKATLRLAVEQLCNSREGIEYFPSFEILNDDLRDYRFYASDMKHPSDTAVNYIMEKFSETYFDEATRRVAAEFERQAARAAHIERN